MMLKLFKTTHPIVFFLIPILGIVLWLPSLFSFKSANDSISIYQTSLLFQWCCGYLLTIPKVSVWLALFFLVLQSFILIRLNFRFIFIENKTYLPAVMFVLLGSMLLPFQKFHPALVANFFLLAAMNKSFVIDKERNQIKRYFESGFLIGMASLFYPNSYLFLIFIGFALLILHNSSWREWIGTIIGFSVPIIFYFAILFLNNKHQLGFENLRSLLNMPSSKLSITYWMLIPLGILAFMLLISLFWSFRFVGIKKISSRKYFNLFFLFFVIAILAILFHPFVGFEFIFILALPSAILFSVFFVESRTSWFLELTFTLTFFSVVSIIWMF